MSIISSIQTSNAISLFSNFNSSSPSILSLPSVYYFQQQQHRRCSCAIKTGSQESFGPDLLKKPVITPPSSSHEEDHTHTQDLNTENDFDTETCVDWEDRILQDTVPLVGFVRMILHSAKYKSGDRLSAEHEKTILERLLPYHPECDQKIGCGIDYITVGCHPQFQDSRCMFIVRKDGELIDFSYWKCIKGFIRKNYPLYAESFILKHFRRRKRYE